MKPPSTPAKKPNLQDKRSSDTRKAVFAATIGCLDNHGYAETTFARVQQASGLSRGAITHHFPNKQTLVAQTTMNLLTSILRPAGGQGKDGDPPRPVRDLILTGWKAMVQQPEGRAFVEILVACRTDDALRSQLADQLYAWDRDISASISKEYIGHSGEDDDAELLWAISRSFFRGLIIHQQFAPSETYILRMIERFADIMGQQMAPRDAS